MKAAAALLSCLLLAAGCASAPPLRFYTLSTAAPDASQSAPAYALFIAPLTLPGSVDRPQLVAQLGPNRVAVLDQERWAEPLKDQIARALAADLAAELPQARVLTSRDNASLAALTEQWRLTLDIRRLEVVPGEAVTLEAQWSLRLLSGPAAPGQAASRGGHLLLREPSEGAGMEAAVAAHDRLLARLARELAPALRSAREPAR